MTKAFFYRSMAALILLISHNFILPTLAFAGKVEVQNNQLVIDGKPQPQLFGAEVQYFRIRGGFGPNVPREKVLKLWNKALDKVVEAHMNTVSFYIPWDFHEYSQGHFDFDGTADKDHDGNADYPSRDVKTFIRLIEERGIRHIMVRPGPYINAEWGFLGFGAIPLWFHEAYPDSHMRNSYGLRTKLYDYHNSDLLRLSEVFFKRVYQDVLKDHIGPGKSISFLQLDNETNFMWQSIYNHDYSHESVKRYQDFLRRQYANLEALNEKHQRSWKSWEEVRPPNRAKQNLQEDQDWYRFSDESIYLYLAKIRKIWEKIGVHEPDVLFTLADSYNGTQNGIIPNYELHNKKDITGLLTVNLYPKTYETPEKPLLNLPFKSDHDVKAQESASEYYLGAGEHFAMGPEIQGGWWKGVPVVEEARQQTYLSVIGHGLKAFFVYYFSEGDNWQSDWAYNQIYPLFLELKEKMGFADLRVDQLPNSFWGQLQADVDRKILVGFEARSIVQQDLQTESQLYFDAPLDYDLNPRGHFEKLKLIGENLIAPYGDFLGKAQELTDSVCILKDQEQNPPSLVTAIDTIEMNTTWSGGLLAYIMQSGANPKILHWGLNSKNEIQNCRIIFRQDSGETPIDLAEELKKLISSGTVVVNLLNDSLPRKMELGPTGTAISNSFPTLLNFGEGSFSARSNPLFYYNLNENKNCQSLFTHKKNTVGYKCKIGKGTIYQVGSLFYDVYNSDNYGEILDLAERAPFIGEVLKEANLTSNLMWHFTQSDEAAGKLVAFARTSENKYWITVKSALTKPTKQFLKINNLDPKKSYRVKDLLQGTESTIKGNDLIEKGLEVDLKKQDSKVYLIQ